MNLLVSTLPLVADLITTVGATENSQVEGHDHTHDIRRGPREFHASVVCNQYQKAKKQHRIDDFKLSTRSGLLVALTDGKQKRWKNLEVVWDLLDNEKAFCQ